MNDEKLPTMPECPPQSQTTIDAKTTILVVDDDPQVLRVMRRIMEDSPYRIETAMSIGDAVRSALDLSPAFVLLDVHLTDSGTPDGLECLRILRKSGYSEPVFMLSADASFEQVHEAAKLGANGYLVKCDPDKFMDHLNKLLQHPVDEVNTSRSSLPPPTTAYLETRGFSNEDIVLLNELARTFGGESDIAQHLNAQEFAVRRQFQTIRNRLGAKNQEDLARILGVLSCFSPIDDQDDS